MNNNGRFEKVQETEDGDLEPCEDQVGVVSLVWRSDKTESDHPHAKKWWEDSQVTWNRPPDPLSVAPSGTGLVKSLYKHFFQLLGFYPTDGWWLEYQSLIIQKLEPELMNRMKARIGGRDLEMEDYLRIFYIETLGDIKGRELWSEWAPSYKEPVIRAAVIWTNEWRNAVGFAGRSRDWDNLFAPQQSKQSGRVSVVAMFTATALALHARSDMEACVESSLSLSIRTDSKGAGWCAVVRGRYWQDIPFPQSHLAISALSGAFLVP
jgi:hypothetical protein